MSSNNKLIIFDASIIIYLAIKSKLDSLFNSCKVFLTEAIYREIKYYKDPISGKEIEIDLSKYLQRGSLDLIASSVENLKLPEFAAKMKAFCDKGKEIHGGELEAISYIFINRDYKFCSSDTVAFKFLSYLELSDNTVSLETIIGRLKDMPFRFTEKCRIECIKEGAVMFLQDFKS